MATKTAGIVLKKNEMLWKLAFTTLNQPVFYFQQYTKYVSDQEGW